MYMIVSRKFLRLNVMRKLIFSGVWIRKKMRMVMYSVVVVLGL